MKKFWSVILLLSMMLTLISCKKDGESASSENGKVLVDDEEYAYSSLDCEGADFTLLNVNEGTWGTNTALVPESVGGEVIPNAVFERNKLLEQKFNVNFKIVNKGIYETANYVTMMVQSQESSVDAGLVLGEDMPSVIQSGAAQDLSSIGTLQLYEEWWNQEVRAASQFGSSSKLYYAQSDLSLMAFDLTWCIIANQRMLSEKQMGDPYELVKSGKWTFEKLNQMCLDGMDLNGDSGYSVKFDEAGKCIYGLTTYDNFILGALLGSDLPLVKKDEVNLPYFAVDGDERFIDFSDKLKKMFMTSGVGLISNGGTETNYELIFEKERAVFVGAEIKAATRYRSVAWDYSILPIPKYDEAQENYRSATNYLAPVLVIPVTNSNTERAGIILDAMAYLSRKDVLPIYYENTLCLRSVKDPQSAEMLDIIRDTRVYDTSLLYGWTVDFYDDYKYAITTVSKTVPSTLATHRNVVKKTINAYRETIN